MSVEISRLLSTVEEQSRARMAAEEAQFKEVLNAQDAFIKSAREQLDGFSENFSHIANDVSTHWRSEVASQKEVNDKLVDGLQRSLEAFNESFTTASASLLNSFNAASASLVEAHAEKDQQRLEQWVSALSSVAETLSREWQQSGARVYEQHQHICAALEKTAEHIASNAEASSTKLLNEMAHLLKSSEELVRARMTSEEIWLKEHAQRMDHLTAALHHELSTLRDDEAERASNAVEQLKALQSAVAGHLSTLGAALEAPMTRLINTASEAPRAAAEVIAQLCQEISKNIERDNGLLEERSRIMKGLDTLLYSLHKTSADQHNVIEKLVSSSADMLKGISTQFTEQVGEEASRLTELAAQVSGSA
ncbi:MAG TPA: DUF802 domain-containing protein, partial [Blastocatellia bacterium]|nr:DUF802 domain-containing protein [Blastocatellia bacterium]